MFLTSEMYRNGKKYNLVVVVRESKIPKEVKEKLFSVDEYSLRVVLKDVSSSPNVSETIDSLFNIAKKKIYINYGYLVFEFNKKNLELESFDAYVVPEYKTIEVPKSFIPSIMCLNKKDVNLLEDDRFTINIKPKYYYDKKNKVFEIFFGNEVYNTYSVAQDIFVSMDDKNNLQKIIIKSI